MPKMPENIANDSEKRTESDKLRPYLHHHISLDIRGGQAFGDCPFCGRDGKFTVHVDTGLWRCFVCGTGTDAGGGNPLVFVRTLWDRSDAQTTNDHCRELANERRLLDLGTVGAWGCCRSLVDGKWMIPGYDPATGKLYQLYRRTTLLKDGKLVPTLLPTPGLWQDGKAHGLHTASASMDPKKPNVDIFEGPWDGMVWWEVARQCKWQDGKLVLTGSEASSLVGQTNVFAVPGCNTFRQEWASFCRGKDVTLWYDNDHPLEVSGQRAGWDGMRRVATMLKGVARSVKILRWGPDGYDHSLPTGFDVRDCLSAGGDIRARIGLLDELYKLVAPAPEEWATITTKINGHSGRASADRIEPKHCTSWRQVEDAWADGMRWRQCLGDVLSTAGAVVVSTMKAGDQLFLQLIGDAGSGKTRICQALLVSKHCYPLRHMTGFHSGFKSDDGRDLSLISRVNGMALVTPEGDVLMSSPKFDEIMSQARQIFDGESGAVYKNTDKDQDQRGLRTPWIMAGTPALMDKDQSRLGDRFMRICMDVPTHSEKRAIMERVCESAFDALFQSSGEDPTMDVKLREAYALTGGYIDHLWSNMDELISKLDVDRQYVGSSCMDLAEFAADLRARPNPDTKKLETSDTKEMPTRLTHQFVRLACCCAVFLNKRTVDEDVLRTVKKVAFDTARGKTLDMVNYFMWTHPRRKEVCQVQGLMLGELSGWLGWTEEKLDGYMRFLRKIGVIRFIGVPGTRGIWKLTDRMVDLYSNVTNR